MAPRILIAGGYGIVGSTIARHLRSVSKRAELILAGRNPDKATALADELWSTTTVRLDVEKAGGLPDLTSIDLIVSALYDPANVLVEAAMKHGIAHVGLTTKADDLAPIALAALRTPPKRPIVVLGYGAAGAIMHVALQAAHRFARVDSVEITALYDVRDPVGPLTAADADMLIARALIRTDGNWQWVDGRQDVRSVQLADGNTLEACPTGLLDAAGLAAMTGARNVRFAMAQGDSLGTRGGDPASSDAYIDIGGLTNDGAQGSTRTVVSDPHGLAHLTALGVLVAAERVLGLDGDVPAAGGLYGAEMIVRPEAAIARLEQFGVRITTEAGVAS